jgi:GTP cyclohydrolase I
LEEIKSPTKGYIKGTKEKLPTKICNRCGGEFHKPSSLSHTAWENVKFCSQECYDHKTRKKNGSYKNCLKCGKEFYVTNYNKDKIFCSQSCDIQHRREYSTQNRIIRERLIKERGNKCEHCGEEDTKILLHHIEYKYDIGINNDYLLLCKNCHQKLHLTIKKEEDKFVGNNKIKRAVIDILEALKIPLNNPNFVTTPERVARSFVELCEGLYAEKEIKEILSTTFPSTNDQMIVQPHIRTFSLCPHHLLLVEYDVSVGYIPKNKVIGLSKLARLVELITKKPELQESITEEITKSLMKHLECLGAMCVIEGKHGCMMSRGVKKNAIMITSSVKGKFRDSISVKNEFFKLIGK